MRETIPPVPIAAMQAAGGSGIPAMSRRSEEDPMSALVPRGFESAQTPRPGTQIRVTTMVNYISALAFMLMLIAGILIAAGLSQIHPLIAVLFGVFWLFLSLVVSSSVRLAAQWEKAVVFRLGKYHTMKGPGLFMVVPLIDQIWTV